MDMEETDMEEFFDTTEEYEKYRNNKAIEDMGLGFLFVNRSAAPKKMNRSSSPKKMIVLVSREGETFEVEESVALESQTINEYLEENPYDRKMSFLITSNVMAKVVEYLKRHVDVKAKSSSLKKFDAEFVKVDPATLTALRRAAIALQIKSLYDLIVQVKYGKRPFEARKNYKMSSKEIIEAVAGVESGNEILSGLLSVASTLTQPQNAEMLKSTRDFICAFRSSKEFKLYPHEDKRQKAATNE